MAMTIPGKSVYVRMQKFLEQNNFETLATCDTESLKLSEQRTIIQEFYADTSIFITGGTGFLGKVLIEKLLRSCPDIRSIYMLVRPKKGKDIHTRISEIFEDVVFRRLEIEQPKFRHKIVCVFGDVALPRLGLSEVDEMRITNDVSIIFHGAASVRFDDKLKVAVGINVKGTKEILNLGRKCTHLKSIVHVSTAYSNCTRKHIDEVFYDPLVSSLKIIELIDTMDEKELDKITPSLLGDYPNTYAFTKCIAEDLIKKCSDGLPICVFRPSIVIATYKEPIRSWIDNLYGPTGVLVGAGTGVLHSLHCDKNCIADMVPVDYTVNALISAAFDTATNFSKENSKVKIFNYVSYCQNPITWGLFTNLNLKYGIDYPTLNSIWYYSFKLNKNRLLHLIYCLFLHFIPAFFADSASVCTGSKLRLMKIYKKIHKFTYVISYFATKQWSFTNDNVQNLWKQLRNDDKKLFCFDLDQLNWEEYNETLLIGLRSYLVKDDPNTLHQARKRWFRMKLLHHGIQIIASLIVLRIVWAVASSFLEIIFPTIVN